MKRTIFAAAAFTTLVSTSAFAVGTSSGGGVGPEGLLLSCEGRLTDATPVKFKVRRTVVPTFIQGILVTEEPHRVLANLKCDEGEDIVSGVPSAGQTLWTCKEVVHIDDGDISVEVMRGGPMGIVTGQIAQKQMFPLPKAILGSLVCNQNENAD